ncbi:MAG: DPP IV N-terminal domain-containing protein, partial [bacterium]|nr:DPP IV N-terminal domain-containing protein [bacterium]
MKKLLTGLTIAAAAAAAFMLLSPSPAEAAESKGSSQPSLYTFNDFMKVKWIKEPVLSPNGKKILFTMEKKNLEENKAMSSICSVSTETKEITSFTPENGRAYSAKWSPDGKKIAFIKSEDGDAQLWIMTSTG